MKAKIHPRYQTCTAHCACGNTFVTRSTMPKINVDICNQCHPFFTGKQKFVDTAGRVERFSKKFGGTYSFQKSTVQELDSALGNLKQRGMRSLVWDLRGNPGGLRTAAVEVLDVGRDVLRHRADAAHRSPFEAGNVDVEQRTRRRLMR